HEVDGYALGLGAEPPRRGGATDRGVGSDGARRKRHAADGKRGKARRPPAPVSPLPLGGFPEEAIACGREIRLRVSEPGADVAVHGADELGLRTKPQCRADRAVLGEPLARRGRELLEARFAGRARLQVALNLSPVGLDPLDVWPQVPRDAATHGAESYARCGGVPYTR